MKFPSFGAVALGPQHPKRPLGRKTASAVLIMIWNDLPDAADAVQKTHICVICPVRYSATAFFAHSSHCPNGGLSHTLPLHSLSKPSSFDPKNLLAPTPGYFPGIP